ncbi:MULTISPECIES: DMT family transporter [Nocardiopsis]|uniref:Multidrug transporter n=1 Tax=Nocardiopsis sinuspersici TaxID=501010 RepID=A0A1V3C7P6_9ACTN|nr:MULTISPECIES: multidrug efflux SMR transporter [Nocardiopsis]NYH53049.1 small multidrug resistance pump [Nocardiopsis sinuspersici]OOC56420.1 multidrug transporter [Nocardiopsis sinuspersici]
MSWLWLVGAIISEVIGTTSLKLSEGFTRLVPTVFVVLGYVGAFLMLSQSLTRGMDLGVAYGVWAAVGIALVAMVGTMLFGESLTWVQVGGIAMIIAGVMALEMGGRH